MCIPIIMELQIVTAKIDRTETNRYVNIVFSGVERKRKTGQEMKMAQENITNTIN